MRVITAVVTPEGKVIIDAEGFVGPECSAVTEVISGALGDKEGELFKPEFYLTQNVDNRIRR